MTHIYALWTMVLEKTLESPLDCKEIQPVHHKKKSVWNNHWKDWCWSWGSNYLPTWWEKLSHWKNADVRNDWSRKRRGRQDEMVASPSLWTWAWVSSGSWWWMRKPGMLQFITLQRDGHDWKDQTELNKLRTKRLINLIASSWWLAAHNNTLLK